MSRLEAHRDGFLAATSFGASRRTRDMHQTGIQKVWAVCEVTGGGKKVYGAAIEFSEDIDPSSLALDSFKVEVASAGKSSHGAPPGPGGPCRAPPGDQSGGPPGGSSGRNLIGAKECREIAAVYTSAEPTLLPDQKSIPGPFIIAELHHNPNLSLPTTDGDEVTVFQEKTVTGTSGAEFGALSTAYSNAGGRGASCTIRGVDDWEQNHWFWSDNHATYLEYSIFLPKSFLEEDGDAKEYPLVLAMAHSGTAYDGTCAETLTEQPAATIWSLPEEQARNECVVITPRYERTTMNDYWEHTHDVENTHRLVEYLKSHTWDHGNPNLEDRRDKVLKIDPKRIFCTGWSMGGMTALWLMARHPETFAAGFINAAQQRPKDLIPLAAQKVLIITGTLDRKATPWNERCCEEWAKHGAKITRPTKYLDRDLIFPIEDQKELSEQIESYLAENSNITYLTFENVDHMASLREFFHIRAARDWLFKQAKD